MVNDDEGSDVSLNAMLYSVSDVNGLPMLVTVPTAHILIRKSDVHILDGIGCALQECLMHFTHRFECCIAASITTS